MRKERGSLSFLVGRRKKGGKALLFSNQIDVTIEVVILL
jgi:hypothetical protein